jgi:hypothetical protein
MIHSICRHQLDRGQHRQEDTALYRVDLRCTTASRSVSIQLRGAGRGVEQSIAERAATIGDNA